MENLPLTQGIFFKKIILKVTFFYKKMYKKKGFQYAYETVKWRYLEKKKIM